MTESAVGDAPPTSHPGKTSVAAVARGGLANLFGAVVSAAANFGLVLVVARFVPPHYAGIYFSATSVFLILEMAGRLGADTGAVYFVARWRAIGQDWRIAPGLRIAFRPVVVVCVLAGIALFALAAQVADLLGDPSGQSIGLLRLLAVTLPISAVYDVALGATRGFGLMRPTVLIEKIIRPLGQVALAGVVLTAGWRGGLGMAWSVPYLAGWVGALWMLRRALHAHQPTTSPPAQPASPTITREFWSFTLPRAVASVAQIVLQRLDIVLVAALRGPREAAIYTAVTRFLVVGQFINQAITLPIQPALSAALSADDHVHARELYRASTTWLVLASWPLFCLGTVLAPIYVALFGHSYRSGVAVVVVLALTMLLASGVGLVDTVIIMAGRTSWNLGTTAMSLVINVGVDVALIPHFGIMGAAVGWCASIAASNLVALALVWRGLGMHPFGASVGAACVLSAGCFLVLPLVSWLAFGRTHVAPVAGCVVGIVVFVLALRRWQDLFDLRGLLRRPVAAS
jgi:O-antigen/teichoic acid export membrane protein